jgi:hypothetical protein
MTFSDFPTGPTNHQPEANPFQKATQFSALGVKEGVLGRLAVRRAHRWVRNEKNRGKPGTVERAFSVCVSHPKEVAIPFVPMKVGSRVTDGISGEKGTVRYFGAIEGAKNKEYVGVEWDAKKPRGHDGIVKGFAPRSYSTSAPWFP